MTGTALALRKEIIGTLEQNSASLVPYLPEGVSPARVIGLVKMAIDDNAKLLECRPATVLRAVAKICSWGADIGTEAYLVPYGATCTPVADYKWKCDLVVQAGGARGIKRNVVREGDEFSWSDGTKLECRHVPADLIGKKAGKITGAYAIALLGHDQAIGVYWPMAKLEPHRQKYSKQWKNGEMPDWWAIKTVIHDLVKTLPKSARTAAMFARLEKMGDEELAALEEAEHADLNPADEVRAPEPEHVTVEGEVIEEFGGDFEIESDMSLDQACAMVLPGKPNESKVWGGKGGFRLDAISDELLGSAREWCEKKLDPADPRQDFVELVKACEIVQKARAARTIKAPEKTPAATTSAPKREPIGASVGLPGNDDELPF